MPQFQYIQIVLQQVQRCREIPETVLAVRRFHTVPQFVFAVVRQEPGQYRQSPIAVRSFPHGIDFRQADGREFFRNKKSSVCRQSIGDRVSRAHHIRFPSCANV